MILRAPRFNEAPTDLPGNFRRGSQRELLGEASMRPRQICRGIFYGGGRRKHPHLASMRPRQICRGIPPLLRGSAIRKVGFNEAPTDLPGNCSPVLMPFPVITASMRPRQICRGIEEITGEPDSGICASMRPRQICRGILINGRATQRPKPRFNEAPTDLPGNSRAFDCCKRAGLQLQ